MHTLFNVDALKPAMVNAHAVGNYGAKSLKAVKITSVDGPFGGFKSISDLKAKISHLTASKPSLQHKK